MLPSNTATVLAYLFPDAKPLRDWLVSQAGNAPVIAEWHLQAAQPSESEIIAAANSAEFAAWLETHGGNALKTAQRLAKEALANSNEESLVRDRAIVATLLDEINTLRQWITSFKAATAAATSLANLQSRVAALANTPDRTPAQARTAISSKIDVGGGYS